MARLPIVSSDDNQWGSLLNEFLLVGHNGDGKTKAARVVTEYGADPSGATPSAEWINAAITASEDGDAIVFPGGTYMIDEPVLLKANRAYIGVGDVWLKQKASTAIECLVKVNPAEAYPRRNILWQSIKLNGDAMDPNTGLQTHNTLYTEANGLTNNVGMKLDSVQFSNFIDLHIIGCGNTGLVIRGTDDVDFDFDKTTSTLHFVSPYIYGNGKYGVFFGERADDNHILGGDIGANNYENVYVVSGSSSVRDTTVWGSKRANGILLGGPTNQVIGCQVEGNAQHGIKVTDYGSYNFINSCKVYYNSTETPGAFDGINISGTAEAHQPRYCTISDNFIYAGVGDFFLTDGEVDPTKWVGHRHAIALEEFHDHCVVNGNSVDLNAPGAGYGDTFPDSYALVAVDGLKVGDQYNGVRWTDAAEDDARLGAPTVTVAPGVPWYRDDTGSLWFYTGTTRGRKERLLSGGYDVDSGTHSVGAAETVMTITIPTERFDDNYTIVASPSWNTTWWVTDKFTDQFTVHFGTAPGTTSNCDWHLFRQGD